MRNSFTWRSLPPRSALYSAEAQQLCSSLELERSFGPVRQARKSTGEGATRRPQGLGIVLALALLPTVLLPTLAMVSRAAADDTVPAAPHAATTAAGVDAAQPEPLVVAENSFDDGGEASLQRISLSTRSSSFPSAASVGGTVVRAPGIRVAPNGYSQDGFGWSGVEKDHEVGPGRGIASVDALQGWDHIYQRLVAGGIDPSAAAQVLSDSRMPSRDPLYFSLNPRESKDLYRKHNSYRNRRNAMEFYREHESSFRRAEREFGVPRHVILALLQVETGCGRNTGRSRVIPGLARLAAAATPENIRLNVAKHRRGNPRFDASLVEARARYLEQTFLPHLAAAIRVAGMMGVEPLELRGSGAGAMGIPQFLPGNFLTYGVDGDGNGRVDPFSEADAILSVGRFLKEHGWTGGPALSAAGKRKAIWHYNRSEPYISTVLAMASQLERIESGSLTDRPEQVARPRAKTARARRARARR